MNISQTKGNFHFSRSETKKKKKPKTLPKPPSFNQSRTKTKTIYGSHLDGVDPYYEKGGLLKKFLENFADSVVILVDIASGFNGTRDNVMNGSRAHVVGLLNTAIIKKTPIIQVEIEDYELHIPEILQDYENYKGFNKKGNECRFSVYCVIKDYLKTLNINNLFIAGKTRECCVFSTIYGELIKKKKTDIIPNSAAILDYNCYTGSPYTRSIHLRTPMSNSNIAKFPVNKRTTSLSGIKEFKYFKYNL